MYPKVAQGFKRTIFFRSGHLSMVQARHWARILFFGSLLLGPNVAMAGDKADAAINCDIQKGACTQSLAGRIITLEVLPRPVKAMEQLTFNVHIDGATAALSPPHIRLNMPAMDMGKNQVPLKLNAQGIFEGQGVIVRCRSGRRTWKATVDFAEIGSVDFIFDVIY
jgi:hypothetical protein